MAQAAVRRVSRRPSPWLAAAAVAVAAIAVLGVRVLPLGRDTPPGAAAPAAPGAPVAVTGLVAVKGGPPVPHPNSDIHPVRIPVVVRITGTTLAGRRIARTVSTAGRGRFELRIPPGRYRFTAVLYPGSIPLSQEPHAVFRVRPGEPRAVRILEPVL